MARLTLTVTDRQAGRSVRSLLRGELGLSTGCVNRLKRTETGLTCNGVRVFTNAVVRAGDVLAADLSAGEVPTAVPPVPMALDIAFEDEHLLVVNKSAPLAVIPSSLVPGEPILAAGLMAYLGPSASLHPVNRLDRGTTGLMVVAKKRLRPRPAPPPPPQRRLFPQLPGPLRGGPSAAPGDHLPAHRTSPRLRHPAAGGPLRPEGPDRLPPATGEKRPGPGGSDAVDRSDTPDPGTYGRCRLSPGRGLALRH